MNTQFSTEEEGYAWPYYRLSLNMNKILKIVALTCAISLNACAQLPDDVRRGLQAGGLLGPGGSASPRTQPQELTVVQHSANPTVFSKQSGAMGNSKTEIQNLSSNDLPQEILDFWKRYHQQISLGAFMVSQALTPDQSTMKELTKGYFFCMKNVSSIALSTYADILNINAHHIACEQQFSITVESMVERPNRLLRDLTNERLTELANKCFGFNNPIREANDRKNIISKLVNFTDKKSTAASPPSNSTLNCLKSWSEEWALPGIWSSWANYIETAIVKRINMTTRGEKIKELLDDVVYEMHQKNMNKYLSNIRPGETFVVNKGYGTIEEIRIEKIQGGRYYQNLKTRECLSLERDVECKGGNCKYVGIDNCHKWDGYRDNFVEIDYKNTFAKYYGSDFKPLSEKSELCRSRSPQCIEVTSFQKLENGESLPVIGTPFPRKIITRELFITIPDEYLPYTSK